VKHQAQATNMPAPIPQRGQQEENMKAYWILLLLTVSASAMAGDRNPDSSTGIHLSEDVRELLREEMQEIKKGMESLVLSAASGKWEEIEETGRKIQHSYILKKQLSDAQKHELHQALPARFRTIDQKFHYYAGMLSHAAKERDIELVNFYIYRMNESCASCHSGFAKETFPGFAGPGGHEHEH